MMYGSSMADVIVTATPSTDHFVSGTYQQATDLQGYINVRGRRRRLGAVTDARADAIAAALTTLLRECFSKPAQSKSFFGAAIQQVFALPKVVEIAVIWPNPPPPFPPPPQNPPKGAASSPSPSSMPPSPSLQPAPSLPLMNPEGEDNVLTQERPVTVVLIIGAALFGVAFLVLFLVFIPVCRRKRQQARGRTYLRSSTDRPRGDPEMDATWMSASPGADDTDFSPGGVGKLASWASGAEPAEEDRSNQARVNERLQRARRAKSIGPGAMSPPAVPMEIGGVSLVETNSRTASRHNLEVDKDGKPLDRMGATGSKQGQLHDEWMQCAIRGKDERQATQDDDPFDNAGHMRIEREMRI